jgi:hypothetical protein
MTIAIALKVGDGIILGADSASTLSAAGGVANVYFNAEKLVNLVKGKPIGLLTYGLGGLDGRSITALARDLREELTNGTGATPFGLNSYTMQDLAERVKRFFYDDRYVPEFALRPDKQAMGFLIAGFSAGARKSELWTVEVDGSGNCSGPVLVFGEDAPGLAWRGQPEALNRLVQGWSMEALQRLVQAGMQPQDALNLLQSPSQLAPPAMPVQDAVDLVEYLVQVTIGYVRFTPGPPTVAPPIDIAAITKHENFKWVKRKHYFSAEFNVPQN